MIKRLQGLTVSFSAKPAEMWMNNSFSSIISNCPSVVLSLKTIEKQKNLYKYIKMWKIFWSATRDHSNHQYNLLHQHNHGSRSHSQKFISSTDLHMSKKVYICIHICSLLEELCWFYILQYLQLLFDHDTCNHNLQFQ